MVKAGAEEVPEGTLLEALELAHREIVKICDAQEDLRRQVGKDKWLDPELTEELEPRVRPRSRSGSAPRACARPAPSSRSSSRALAAAPMDSTEDDIRRQIQVRSSLALILERQRLEAVDARCASSSRTT